jgi:hypothetical protein
MMSQIAGLLASFRNLGIDESSISGKGLKRAIKIEPVLFHEIF